MKNSYYGICYNQPIGSVISVRANQKTDTLFYHCKSPIINAQSSLH